MGDATKGWGLGIYYHRKTKWKIQPKEVASCSIPYLLIAYTQVHEILVIALNENIICSLSSLNYVLS